MNQNISNLRNDYSLSSLDEKDVLSNPFDMFLKWFDEALKSEINEANAFALATVSDKNIPSVRIVLMKDFDKNGLTFFTNYESNKGKALSANPMCSGVFHWQGLQRQVRFEGVAKKISPKESKEYFHSRPLESRISAAVSPQSKIINGKKDLENEWKKFSEMYSEKEIPCPENWGGYIIFINLFEFWQGRPGRFHDRILFTKTENNLWQIERLAP